MGLQKSYIGQPYASFTHADSFAPKRWLHARRFSDALRLLEDCDRSAILDYGTGDAHFLNQCREKYPDAELWGYDPVDRSDDGTDTHSLRIVHDAQQLPSSHFSTITFLETAEHLTDDELDRAFATFAKVLKPGGTVMISVPVEVGIPAIIKNAYRAVRRKGYERLTPVNFVKAAFGIPFERKVNIIAERHPYIHSHMGFNHVRFEHFLRQRCANIARIGTPVPFLGALLNNSLYYVVTLRLIR